MNPADSSDPPLTLLAGGPRSQLLIRQAYREEGLALPAIDETVAPIALLYPRSFVDAVEAMDHDKIHDYCFIGGVYGPRTFAHRGWILDWARERFTARSYFAVTDGRERHVSVGPGDRTSEFTDVFVPRQVPHADRGFFHAPYYRVMCRSEFTLCPAGDAPWSMRFFEAIMCRSIPVVSSPEHSGRHGRERAIGYTFALAGEPLRYDAETAERNFDLFRRHQTLMAR